MTVFPTVARSVTRTRTTPSVQKARRYWRLSHGWVTPSSLADIMHFEAERDPDNNQMSSIFYGHPLSDTLLGLPLNVSDSASVMP